MKKLFSVLLAVIIAVSCFSVTAFAETLMSFNFDDGDFSGWSHHYGSDKNSVIDGVLVTDRGEANVYYATGYNLGSLTGGLTYTATVDVMCPEGAAADGVSPIRATALLRENDFDGNEIARVTADLTPGEWVTLTFEVTLEADVESAVFTVNYDGSSPWDGIISEIHIDNVSITCGDAFIPVDEELEEDETADETEVVTEPIEDEPVEEVTEPAEELTEPVEEPEEEVTVSEEEPEENISEEEPKAPANEPEEDKPATAKPASGSDATGLILSIIGVVVAIAVVVIIVAANKKK